MATMSKELRSSIIDATKADVSAGKKTTKLIDLMYSQGITPDDLMAPKGDEDRTFYDSVQDAIIAGFDADVQASIAKPDKARDQSEKAIAAYWKRQVAPRLGNWRKALQRRIDQANTDDSNGAGERKSTWESTRRKELSKMIDSAQKLESSTIKDLTAFIKDLQSALARIPSDA